MSIPQGIRRFAILFLLFLPFAALAEPKTVFLTFDDGPREGTAGTLKILDDLNHIKATFFVVGNNVGPAGGAAKQKELFQKIRAAGHKVGNHTVTHQPETIAGYKATYGATSFIGAAQKAAFKKNFDDNAQYFTALLGPPSIVTFKVARLPGDGRTFSYLVDETNSLGMKHYGWNVEFTPNGQFPGREQPAKHDLVRNWQGLAVAASLPTDGLPHDDDVLLFHEFHWASKLDELKKVIKFLQDHECRFALVSD
jgi:peptidoglycan/xylan/chitin deacetylase (PgdA/CDA1 family)